MSIATLAGNRVIAARATIPAVGIWWADVVVDDEVELSGAVKLVLADLALDGTVIAGGPYSGESRYTICGGAGGWGKTLDRRHYSNDLGVKVAKVLTDAAEGAGETLDVSTVAGSTVGSSFTREEGPASRLLHQLAPSAWYVDETGITRLGRRPRVEFEAEATRVSADPAFGTVELAADQITTLLPGCVVDDIEATDVHHQLTDQKLRTRIYGGVPETDNALDEMRRLVRMVLPDYKFRGCFEYRVATREGERLNLQPVRSGLGLPDIRRARVRPGVAGCRADVALGSMVLVTFVDANPARPVVIGFADAEGEGFAPSRLDLVGEDETGVSAAGANGRVVRYGDPVTFPGPGLAAIVPAPAGNSLSRVRA